jgi:YtkA-like
VRKKRRRPLFNLPLRQEWKRLVISVCLAGLGFAGCLKSSGRAPAFSMEHEITPQPPRVGPASVTLRLTDAAAKPVVGAHIAIEGDMSHPGMSPVFGEAKESATGRYEGQIDFAMAGDWVLLFHITLPDGRKLERQVNVNGVRAK